MHRLLRFLRFSFVFAALFPLAASAQNSKISPDTLAAAANGPVHVIVQYNTTPGPLETLLLEVTNHGTLLSTLTSINAQVAEISLNNLLSLANSPEVLYISLDRKVSPSQSVTVQPGVVLTSANYTVEPINAPQVWAKGYNGTGVGIAIIDSGVTPVDDLSTSNGLGYRIVYSQNFVPTTVSLLGVSVSATVPTNVLDQYGHGTHVAGLAAGNGTDSSSKNDFRTFRGSAPNANIINLRVLDQNGDGTDSQVIAAIQQAIQLQKTYNIRVINLSLGRPIWETYKLDPLCQAVEQAWKAGIVVVVAAGNAGRDLNLNPEGYGTIEAPGSDPYVISVGAMNTEQTPGLGDDIIATYSSKGPTYIDHFTKPDVVAPGNLVTSLKFANDSLAVNDPTFETLLGFYQSTGNVNANSANYFPLSGTSMATGVTSGAVALLVQAHPNLTPDQVKAFLMRDADRSYFPQTSSVTDSTTGIVYKANYDAFTIGAGYLDINAALTDINSGTVVPAGTAMSPVATYNPSTKNTTLVTDQTALWGATALTRR